MTVDAKLGAYAEVAQRGAWKHDLYEPEGHEGIAACRVCRGAEGSLPTECPQREMTTEEERAVYDAELDFIHNAWWVPKR